VANLSTMSEDTAKVRKRTGASVPPVKALRLTRAQRERLQAASDAGLDLDGQLRRLNCAILDLSPGAYSEESVYAELRAALVMVRRLKR